MKNLLKQRNTLKRRYSLLVLCLWCAAGVVVAQEQAESKKDVPLRQRTIAAKNVIMGSQDGETSVQAISTVSGDRLDRKSTRLNSSHL